jgi:hypothetical protein
MLNNHFSKGLVLGLCVSAMSSVTFAQQAVCNPASIGVELTGGWFQGMAHNTGYGINAANAVDLPPAGALLRVNPKYEFDGAIALSYDFAASPFSLVFTWWRDHSSKTSNATGVIGVTNTPATWGVDFAAAASSNLALDFDILTLNLAATFYPHCATKLTPQIGIGYIRNKNDQVSTYAGRDIVANSVINVTEDSSFKGWGPTFGINVDYLLCNDFSLFGKFLYAAFLGDINADYNPVQSGAVSRATNVDISSNKQIVNLFQSELGLSYHFDCFCYKSELMLGYVFAKFFGGGENNAFFGDDVSDSLFSTSNADVGFQGPFLRIAVDFPV